MTARLIDRLINRIVARRIAWARYRHMWGWPERLAALNEQARAERAAQDGQP